MRCNQGQEQNAQNVGVKAVNDESELSKIDGSFPQTQGDGSVVRVEDILRKRINFTSTRISNKCSKGSTTEKGH